MIDLADEIAMYVAGMREGAKDIRSKAVRDLIDRHADNLDEIVNGHKETDHENPD